MTRLTTRVTIASTRRLQANKHHAYGYSYAIHMRVARRATRGADQPQAPICNPNSLVADQASQSPHKNSLTCSAHVGGPAGATASGCITSHHLPLHCLLPSFRYLHAITHTVCIAHLVCHRWHSWQSLRIIRLLCWNRRIPPTCGRRWQRQSQWHARHHGLESDDGSGG